MVSNFHPDLIEQSNPSDFRSERRHIRRYSILKLGFELLLVILLWLIASDAMASQENEDKITCTILGGQISIEACTRLIENDEIEIGEKVSYLLKRADEFVSMGEYESSIVDYSTVIILMPKEVAAYAGRSSAYTGAGRHEEAIADYRKADELALEGKDKYPVPQLPATEDATGYEVVGLIEGGLLNVRTQAGSANPIIGQLPLGAIISLGECSKVPQYIFPWCKIQYRKMRGWSYGKFLVQKTTRRHPEVD